MRFRNKIKTIPVTFIAVISLFGFIQCFSSSGDSDLTEGACYVPGTTMCIDNWSTGEANCEEDDGDGINWTYAAGKTCSGLTGTSSSSSSSSGGTTTTSSSSSSGGTTTTSSSSSSGGTTPSTEAPANFTVWQGKSIMRIKLQWDPVTGATGYKVYKSDTLSGTYSAYDTYISSSTTTKTYIFAPGSTYYFKVCAKFSTGDGNFTTALKGTTVATISGGAETESNDTIGTADVVSSGKYYTQSMSSSSDVDFYQITLTTSGKIEAYVVYGSQQTSYSYGIKDLSGTDISVSSSSNAPNYTMMWEVSQNILPAGTYIICGSPSASGASSTIHFYCASE